MFSWLVTYLFILLMLFVFQRKLIYFPLTGAQTEQQENATILGLQLWPEQQNYRGFISSTALPQYKGTILVFHGNAGSAAGRFYYLNALEKLGFRVVIAEYPGYGARDGMPSEQALIADGVQTAQLLHQQFGEPLYLWGESLGSGVVSGIVKTNQVPVKGVILLMPFDTLANVAHSHYWFFLAKWLIRDKYNNEENLKDYKGKTAVVLAENDEIIPKKLTLKLYDALPPAEKKLWILENASHNDFPVHANAAWWQQVMTFVANN